MTISYQLTTINYQLKKNERTIRLAKNSAGSHHRINRHRHHLWRNIMHGVQVVPHSCYTILISEDCRRKTFSLEGI
jgi:hypothetical protein